MKRTNVLIMLLALLLLLSGCSDADRVTVMDSYTLLLSDNSLVDPYTQRVGEMILKNESFVDENIDIEQAENLTKDALNRFISCDTAEITPSLIATNDGTLWLQLQVYVRFDDGAGGDVGGTNTYMIQVATTNAA